MQRFLRSASIDQALRLAGRPLDGPGVVHLHRDADTDKGLHVVGKLAASSRARVLARKRFPEALDVHRESVERTIFPELQRIVRRKPRGAQHELLYLGGEDI